jgi:hypothetical protein
MNGALDSSNLVVAMLNSTPTNTVLPSLPGAFRQANHRPLSAPSGSPLYCRFIFCYPSDFPPVGVNIGAVALLEAKDPWQHQSNGQSSCRGVAARIPLSAVRLSCCAFNRKPAPQRQNLTMFFPKKGRHSTHQSLAGDRLISRLAAAIASPAIAVHQ